MGTSRCTSCGATLPGGARFCPECGAGAGADLALPVLDLTGEVGGDDVESPAPRDRTRTTAVGVVLGLLGLLILLSLVSGDSSDDESSGDDMAPTTVPTTRPTSTTLPVPSSGDAHDLLSGDELLDPAFGMALVWFRSNATVVVADLATGAEVVLEDELPVRPLQVARWTGESFLVVGPEQDLHQMHVATGGEWRQVDTFGHQVDLWWPQPLHGGVVNVWLEGDGAAPVLETFGLITQTGVLELFDSPGLGPRPQPVALIQDRLVVNIDGGIYIVDGDGSVNRHAFGTVLGASDRYLVRRSCDESLRCSLVLDDLVAGQESDLGAIEPSDGVIRALPAPDGSAAALVVPDRNGAEVLLRVIPVGGSQSLTFSLGTWNVDPESLVWTADGDALLWREDGSTWVVRAVRWRGDPVSTEPASVELSTRSRTVVGFDGLYLVPLDSLPETWRPVAG